MDPFRKLRGISRTNLLNHLQKTLGDDSLVEQACSVFSEDVTLSDLQGGRFSRDDLIYLASRLAGFTAEDAAELHEEYRYTGMKTVYIYRHNLDPTQLQTIGLSDLGAYLVDLQYSEEGRLPLPIKYRDLQIREDEHFTVGPQEIWELVYSYVASVEVTDPQTEDLIPHDDLRLGFIWINATTSWVAISAKDEDIANSLVEMLRSIFDADIVRVHIPKDVIIEVESYDRMRRTGHQDQHGFSRRTTGPFQFFPDEIAEAQQRDRTQQRTSSSYNVALPDGTEFVLGYNGDKGIIYFQKHLKTSQLRSFCVDKISELFERVEELRSNSPESLVRLVVDDVLSGTRLDTRELIYALGEKLAEGRQSNQSDISLDEDLVLKLAQSHRHFNLVLQVDCVECGDREDVQCSSCGYLRFIATEDGLHCSKPSCDALIGQQVLCLQGHQNLVNSVSELITLFPTQNLLLQIEEIISQVSNLPFNRSEEGFFIRGTTLHIVGRPGEKVVYLLSDIPEFADVATFVPTDIEQAEITGILGEHYREKCSDASVENCARCVDERIGSHCLMRLFGLFDEHYTPRPHSGHEFGDVSLRVTVDGRPRRIMLILLKSGKPNGRPITKSNSIGREIFEQFDQFLNDPSVEVIAIGVPQRIDDGFQARLQYLAQREGKKILFLQADEFTKLVGFVAYQHDLPLDEL